MLYAKVVFSLPIDGPFDYSVPDNFAQKLAVGMRVKVNFSNRNLVGYVVGISGKSSIPRLKPVLDILDEVPTLNKNMLLLTKRVSERYCCSWGEAIDTALPQALRKSRHILKYTQPKIKTTPQEKPLAKLLEDIGGRFRWDFYFSSIKDTLDKGKKAIILFPDINSVLKAYGKIKAGMKTHVGILYRKQTKALEEWLKIKMQQVNVVVGTRSAVFAPIENLGLIIVDEEGDPVYKQDQVPHYNAREVALMRMAIEKTRVILSSRSPSIESFYLAKRGKIEYVCPEATIPTQIKTVDLKNGYYNRERKTIFSKYLQDSIGAVLKSKGKILLFINRKGFATFASCRHCGNILKCPRCNINLVYHFAKNILSCHYCNYKTAPLEICPICNSGYIRYRGIGTEKIESELSRIFPEAKVRMIEGPQKTNIDDADIFIATESVMKSPELKFDLVGVLYVDNLLNRQDLRSAEKTFRILTGLLNFTEKSIVIQTRLKQHQVLEALVQKNSRIFYKKELLQRKQLGFPPYEHLGLLKFRGRSALKVEETANEEFKELSRSSKDKAIKVISCHPAEHPKLRGNFYWQILLKAKDPNKLSRFLKNRLRKISYSGIITTVDIDPL
ncbi:MAG: primosomal protein N' [Candidatus Omnitrophota bacterium]|nr:MAG: primosomal protein N' [Candidatus Omnitrophota bacterium]